MDSQNDSGRIAPEPRPVDGAGLEDPKTQEAFATTCGEVAERMYASIDASGEKVLSHLSVAARELRAANKRVERAMASVDLAADETRWIKRFANLGASALASMHRRPLRVFALIGILFPVLYFSVSSGTRLGSMLLSRETLEFRRNQAIDLLHEGRYEAGIAMLAPVLDRMPDPLVFSERAYAYYQLHQDDKALEDCRSALKIDPRCARSHYVEYLVLERQGKSNAARQALQAAVVFGDPIAVQRLKMLSLKSPDTSEPRSDQ